MTNSEKKQSRLACARRVLAIEADAVAALQQYLDDAFDLACSAILSCSGRVVVMGMGKSGHIARKIAATLASTGTPAFFVHPAEAAHGDLGMLTDADVVIALSNSGESDEILALLPSLKRKGTFLVAMTGNPQSTLAKQASCHLNASVDDEACPLGLAPTASTTAALALGDALAVTLLEERGFSTEDFALSHPGGALGRRLLIHVRDVMRSGEALPKIEAQTPLKEALLYMSRQGMGMTAVYTDQDPALLGIYTDGDLRRTFDRYNDISALKIGDVMSTTPRTIMADQLAVEAVKVMEQYKITALLVLDATGQLCGALNMHDLLRARVV